MNHQGALSFGGRVIASGQLFKIFVPVKTTQAKIGITSSPPDGFYWLTDATGVYANPGLSRAYTAVLPSVAAAGPQIFFQRPGAVPFWKTGAGVTPGTESRAEFFMNLWPAGKTGTLCPVVTRRDLTPSQPGYLAASCALFESQGWGKNVTTQLDQVLRIVNIPDVAKGPLGGWAPIAFDQPGELDKPMRITWTFTPTDGSGAVTGAQDFRTLAGPDTDGDGVVDLSDACPAVKGTTANGCLPPPAADADKDGASDTADRCPTVSAVGFLNGCPKGMALGVRSGAKLRRTKLLRGLTIPVACAVKAPVLVSLTVSRATARRLGLKAKGATLTIGSGRATCGTAKGSTLPLKVLRGAAKRVKAQRRAFSATLVIRPTTSAGGIGSVTIPIKVG
ncbi:MAG: hypothetical protein F2832_00495 [Actinobacteria bacterium]|nr:hypothetical protein [Actinomycetota bacterium]